jgi:hypothetical protein
MLAGGHSRRLNEALCRAQRTSMRLPGQKREGFQALHLHVSPNTGATQAGMFGCFPVECR